MYLRHLLNSFIFQNKLHPLDPGFLFCLIFYNLNALNNFLLVNYIVYIIILDATLAGALFFGAMARICLLEEVFVERLTPAKFTAASFLFLDREMESFLQANADFNRIYGSMTFVMMVINLVKTFKKYLKIFILFSLSPAHQRHLLHVPAGGRHQQRRHRKWA